MRQGHENERPVMDLLRGEEGRDKKYDCRLITAQETVNAQFAWALDSFHADVGIVMATGQRNRCPDRNKAG